MSNKPMTKEQKEKLTKGQMVKFEEDSIPYTVMAANDRFAICTRKLNKIKDNALLWHEVERGAYFTFSEAYTALKDAPIYTIVDFEKNIRGTENLVFCMGFETEDDCNKAIDRLTNGESEISSRNQIELNIISINE